MKLSLVLYPHMHRLLYQWLVNSSVPDCTKSATSVAALSLLSPIFISAFLGMLSRITSVTTDPKLLKILVHSTAIIPDPEIAIDLGKYINWLIESLYRIFVDHQKVQLKPF